MGSAGEPVENARLDQHRETVRNTPVLNNPVIDDPGDVDDGEIDLPVARGPEVRPGGRPVPPDPDPDDVPGFHGILDGETVSGNAPWTSRIEALTCSMASAPIPDVPNWCSNRSGAHTSSTIESLPTANPSSKIRCITW